MLILYCFANLFICLQERAALKLTKPSCFIFKDAILLNNVLLDKPTKFFLLQDKTQHPDAPLLKVYTTEEKRCYPLIPLPDGQDATLEQARSIVQSFGWHNRSGEEGHEWGLS